MVRCPMFIMCHPREAPPKFDAHGKIIEGSQRVPMAELEKLFGKEVHEATRILKDEMKKRKETGVSELMDLLIAYKHDDMFRLDNQYYADVAKAKGLTPSKPIDERYVSGKFTQKIKFFTKGGALMKTWQSLTLGFVSWVEML